jgi:hypothetical protein
MAAELSALQGRPIRLRFALGCARTALVPPVAGSPPAASVRIVVATVALSVIGLGALAQQRETVAPATGRPGVVYEVAVIVLVLAAVVLHAWLVDRRARQFSAQAAVARRWGVAVGVVLGVLALLVTLPLRDGLSSPSVAGLAGVLVFPLVGCLLAGAAAARASGDRDSGYEAGLWAGRVAGSIVAIGLLVATLWATRWFANDPATISTFRRSLTAAGGAGYRTHFATIAGFVVSENIDTAFTGALVMFPLIGLVSGAVGGMIGSSRHLAPGYPARGINAGVVGGTPPRRQNPSPVERAPGDRHRGAVDAVAPRTRLA